VLIVALFVAELVDFASVRVEHHVEVDGKTMADDELTTIELEVLFRELSCEEAHFEVQDNKGKLYLGADVEVRKSPVSAGFFGAGSGAPRNKRGEVKGCVVAGTVRVHTVPGNIHVLPDAFSATAHRHGVLGGGSVGGPGLAEFNASHVIRKLRFAGGVPNVPNPLDDVDKSDDRVVQFRYYVQVVPTTFRGWAGGEQLGAQIAVAEHVAEADFSGEPGGVIPGFLVQFEFAPMRVVIEETRRPLLELLASLAAILGGIFTVASTLDASLFRAQEVIGKQD
jgi:Endoplasmic reticulum vesicle transporter/Endoplasmic Reticulum-Golgi Intermediate Compartment (ERGIC)